MSTDVHECFRWYHSIVVDGQDTETDVVQRQVCPLILRQGGMPKGYPSYLDGPDQKERRFWWSCVFFLGGMLFVVCFCVRVPNV